MKVLKPANMVKINPVWRYTCRTCDCRFEFDRGDRHSDQRDGDYVQCPGCKSFIDWSVATRGSR